MHHTFPNLVFGSMERKQIGICAYNFYHFIYTINKFDGNTNRPIQI